MVNHRFQDNSLVQIFFQNIFQGCFQLQHSSSQSKRGSTQSVKLSARQTEGQQLWTSTYLALLAGPFPRTILYKDILRLILQPLVSTLVCSSAITLSICYRWCSPPAAPPASPALEKLPRAECPLTSRGVPLTVDPPVWAPNNDCKTEAPPSGNWDPRYCPTDPVVEETATGPPPTFPLSMPPPLLAAADMKRFWLARLLLVFSSQSRGAFCFWRGCRWSEPLPPWAPPPLPPRVPASWLRKGLAVM